MIVSRLWSALAALSFAAAAASAQQPGLSGEDEAAAFRAAGFAQRNDQWRSDCGDPGTQSYQPGEIAEVRDLNGDSSPEAIVTEGSTFCYGNDGIGFVLVSKRKEGVWTALYRSQGMPTILDSRVNGWPEIEVGGAGFCFPVLQWNGREFAVGRHAYEGQACTP